RHLAAAYAQSSGRVAISVDALPQPFSPSHWKLVVVTGDRYHIAYVNLLDQVRWPVPLCTSATLGMTRCRDSKGGGATTPNAGF
ncbi:MAG: hypothetical protein ACPGOX_08055, partial [Flavobacteriales bacterium]